MAKKEKKTTQEVVEQPINLGQTSLRIVQRNRKHGMYGDIVYDRFVEYVNPMTVDELVASMIRQIGTVIDVCKTVAENKLPMRSFLKIRKGADLFFTIIINDETVVSTTVTPMQLAYKGEFLSHSQLSLLAHQTVKLANNY